MKLKLLCLTIITMGVSGCSMLSPNINAAEEAAATALVNSSERVLCRDIPVGTWMRMYGSNEQRMQAWRALCLNKPAAPVGS